MSRFILLLILSFAARADKTAAPAGPIQLGSRSERSDLSGSPDPSSLVCSNLSQAVCFQEGKLINDGTGSTQEARTLNDSTLQNARDYFQTRVATDSKFVTSLNALLSDRDAQSDLRTITGETCNLTDEACRSRVKSKFQDVLKVGFLRDTRLVRYESITEHCIGSDCPYSASQKEAFYRLTMAGKVAGFAEVSSEHAGRFFELQNGDARKRVLELFPKVREELKRVVAGMGLTADMQDVISKKLDSVSITTDCLGEGYDPHGFAYSRILEDGTRQIVICDGMLTGNSSDFNLVYTLAHELTHQFDPCYIHYGSQNFHYKLDPQAKSHEDYEKQNPFYDGIKCLRDPKKSVGAVLTSNYIEQFFFSELNLDAPVYEKATPFCDSDRMPETFADAVGVKALAAFFQNPDNTDGRKFTKEQWRAGLLNASMAIAQPSVNCKSQAMFYQNRSSEYPTEDLRLNGLIMANTEIRRLAGCETKSSYAQCL